MGANGSLPAYQSENPVAVDATGGDRGLEVQVEGAIQAYREFGARSVLVGPREDLEQLLQGFGAAKLPISIHHASQTIEMDESPTRSVRRKPDSSLCVAYNLVRAGSASSVISSGNSGAMMAAGIIISGLIPGIERPAIATTIPAAGNDRPNVILDVGANVDCHAHNLLQFAVMGSIYYNCLFDAKRPRVALLSNGTESSKGTDVIRAAALVLAQLDSINYVGYVEGRDVSSDHAEVIVCDGFVGNIVLKAMEGCVQLVAKQFAHEAKKGLFRKLGLGLSRGVFREVFQERFDYATHGGAPLLGLRDLALVLHGASDARAVKNAIRVADQFARRKMTEKIGQELGRLEEQSLQASGSFFSNVLSRKSMAESVERAVQAEETAAAEEAEEDTPLQANGHD